MRTLFLILLQTAVLAGMCQAAPDAEEKSVPEFQDFSPNFRMTKSSPYLFAGNQVIQPVKPVVPVPEQAHQAAVNQSPQTQAPPPPRAPENTGPSLVEATMNESHLLIDAAKPQPASSLRLSQFGYDFFRPEAAGFAPMVDVPVGPDYVVGVGDRLVVTVTGSSEGSYELEVNRQGEIILPRVGAIKVLGVTYGQLPGIVRSALARVFRDFQVSVNVGKVRMIKVYLVGEVQKPGDYNIHALSTLINALAAAGGPTKNGSLRKIEVKRGGNTVETVDLYDFFLKGDKSRDIRLQSGDTIFVPVVGPVVGVGGSVRRPAIFELKNEKTLKDALALSGGISAGGYLSRVQITRVEAHDRKMVTDFNLDPKRAAAGIDELTGSIGVQDMDHVAVFPIEGLLRDYVRVTGHVLRPGDYSIRPGTKISMLLPKEDLLPEYSREYAELTRFHPPDYQPRKLYLNLEKALSGDPREDLELKEFDSIRIFSRWEMEEIPKVRIAGDVQKPGEYRLYDDLTVRELVLMAGNPKRTAFLKNAEITRLKKTGESVTSFSLTVNLEEALKGNPEHNIKLEPYDELNVRRIPDWAEETQRYVSLKGEFRFPGTYPIYKGEKLSTVIERAGGFTDKAYLPAAKFTRLYIQQLQQKRMDESIAKAEQEIIKKQADIASVAASKEELEATKAALEGLQRSLEVLKRAKAEGRVVIALADMHKFRGSRHDVELMGGDQLEVPQKPNAVNVLGQVYNPNSIIPEARQDVAFYLEKAGGPTKEADEDEIYIVRVDSTVQSRQQVSCWKSLFFSGFMSTELNPGDTIIVPQQYEKVAWMRDIKDIAFIIGQAALAAGVLIAAGL